MATPQLPADLAHWVGGDLALSATGDLATSTDITRAQQRILRRLMTNPGDYICHVDYGAGVPAAIGTLLDLDATSTKLRGQMLLEEGVAQTPPPTVQVVAIPNGVSVSVQFTLESTGAQVSLSFNVNE